MKVSKIIQCISIFSSGPVMKKKKINEVAKLLCNFTYLITLISVHKSSHYWSGSSTAIRQLHPPLNITNKSFHSKKTHTQKPLLLVAIEASSTMYFMKHFRMLGETFFLFLAGLALV